MPKFAQKEFLNQWSDDAKVLVAHLVFFPSSFTFSLQKLQEKADTYWAQPTNSHQQAHHERGGGVRMGQ
jgi:hypothetical protein